MRILNPDNALSELNLNRSESMKKSILISILLLASSSLFAASVDNGKIVAQKNCKMCHHMNGIASGSTPNLAGQSETYIVTQLKDFANKNGQRKNAMMKMFASKLKANEIEDVAAYYASLLSCK